MSVKQVKAVIKGDVKVKFGIKQMCRDPSVEASR